MKILLALLLLAVSAIAQPASQFGRHPNLLAGLVGYWTANEGTGTSVRDWSNWSNSGSLSNSPPWTNGIVGGGLFLNGTSQAVIVTDNGFPTGSAVRTVSFWLRNTVTHSVDNTFFTLSYGAVSGNDLYAVGWQRHVAQNYLYVSTASLGILSTACPQVDDLKWHFAVIVYDGANENFYLDGSFLSSSAHTVATTRTGTAYLGRYSGGLYYGGVLDEWRIYNRALSASEVSQLYWEAQAQFKQGP